MVDKMLAAGVSGGCTFVGVPLSPFYSPETQHTQRQVGHQSLYIQHIHDHQEVQDDYHGAGLAPSLTQFLASDAGSRV